MTHIIRFREEAEQDLVETAHWYERQKAGLGQAFLDGVLATANKIAEHPTQYPAITKRLRRALLLHFPFAIFYEVKLQHIVVVAVMHARRNPKCWASRRN